ncbi:MAG: hypothetical protein A3F72_00440 [Bacteroidetes bacterium RIFCSPLOWO2_12_FULL_35_15]|nr:MAG: hypothetical protein A3F72_00440 [Bacteroidetes bacterium RIFCSPLOWO2_12_FULL_35_15]
MLIESIFDLFIFNPFRILYKFGLNRYLIYLYLIPSGFYVENFTLAEIVNAQKNEVKNLNQ